MVLFERTMLLQTSEEQRLARAFPRDFLWGASTSAYQVEGATAVDGRGPSIWDQFTLVPGKIAEGVSGRTAADHYRRYPEDFDLMQTLGLTAYGFSVSWPRILPAGTGAVNMRGLDFYDRLVDHLLEHEITPLLTLYAWDLPLALQERGGWLQRETALAFAEYAEIVARRLGDRVRWWQTMSDPWSVATLGYGTGEHAPGLRTPGQVPTVGHHLLLAHGLAISRLRSHVRSDAQLGITLHMIPAYAADERPETQATVEDATLINRWFADPLLRGSYPARLFELLEGTPPTIEPDDLTLIHSPLDFLGLNYYSRVLYATDEEGRTQPVYPVPGAEYTAMAWEIYPQGLYDILAWLQDEYRISSLIVMENGAAFADTWNRGDEYVNDPQRTQYIHAHLQAIADAIAAGIPVHGHFACSLLDAFEWACGYSQRFGLIYVDYATQRRIPKESGRWYARLIQEHARWHSHTLSPSLPDRRATPPF